MSNPLDLANLIVCGWTITFKDCGECYDEYEPNGEHAQEVLCSECEVHGDG